MASQPSPPSDIVSPSRPRNSRDSRRDSTYRSHHATKLVIFLSVALLLPLTGQLASGTMWSSASRLRSRLLLGLGMVSHAVVGGGDGDAVDIGWYPPAQMQINNLTAVVNGKGVHGFIYNSSDTPDDLYGLYNWCNMPHVRQREYVRVDAEYELVYVELIHRHHKRTPYASNSFPVESYPWDCDDTAQFHHASSLADTNQTAMPAYWKLTTSSVNPFSPSRPGFRGTCQFPQITSPGLSDSWKHGADLYDVYHTLLGLLPSRDDPIWLSRVVYHVTNNPITAQVAGMLVHGTWRTTCTRSVPLFIQDPEVDSLEPRYPCPLATSLFTKIQSRSDKNWAVHLDAATPLFKTLDGISGVPPSDAGFHASMDHYYDNLSARQCHQKPLPCSVTDSTRCITQEDADAAYRFGHWEYSHVYRGAGPDSLAASAGSFGVWIAELAANLRKVINGEDGVVYRHHVAHDGSVSRLLGVLQADEMVWPGMGSEVVFELYQKTNGKYFVRVLFGGRVLRSSNPSLGVMDLISADTLLRYFDGLVGKDAGLIVGKCNGS